MINNFTSEVDNIPLPEMFPSPFDSDVHPLCRIAAGELMAVIAGREEWQAELEAGKMFGVLVVRQDDGRPSYLAAFSGNIAGSNHHQGFVPPVYDLLNPQGFFKIEEQEITDINSKVAALESAEEYRCALAQLQEVQHEADLRLSASKENLKKSKQKRDNIRRGGCSPADEVRLNGESQFEKAEHKRLEMRMKALVDDKLKLVDRYREPIDSLKERRKQLSAALQLKIFNRFILLNANGEETALPAIFAPTPQRIPPAGAGECAGPKLLQYAFANGLKPVCMAEFWWGSSPRGEVRHHGHFYPACKGKCEPILNFMLKGIDVGSYSRNHYRLMETPLDIVYEDEWIVVVNKPAGMLSVPARGESDSVLQRLMELYPSATGPLLVHRLDMDTSGLLVAAKSIEVYRHLQSQFANREVKKKYVAVLDGVLERDGGEVNIPLSPDYINRPMQMVDFENGKEAVTRWSVVARGGGRTVVELFPLTGRTHQLRVHCAHEMGLACPIVGDELYGRRAERLYLHAAKVEFVHPFSNDSISFNVEAPFLKNYSK